PSNRAHQPRRLHPPDREPFRRGSPRRNLRGELTMTIDVYFVNRAANDFPNGATPVLSTPQMPDPVFPGRLTGTRPGLRARSAAHAAFKAAEQHLANVTAAAKYTHPDVAPDALPELRQTLHSTLTQRAGAQFDDPLGLIQVAERAHEEAEKAADKYRPKL